MALRSHERLYFLGFTRDFDIYDHQFALLDALPNIDINEFQILPERVREIVQNRRASIPDWWYFAIEYAEKLRKIEVDERQVELKRHLEWYQRKLKETSDPEVLVVGRGRNSAPSDPDHWSFRGFSRQQYPELETEPF